MDRKIYKLLIKSMDDELSNKAKQRLNMALNDSPELQKEKKYLLKIRNLIKMQEYKTYPFFAEKVMNKILQLEKGQNEYIDFTDLFLLIFKRVSFSGFAIFLILLAGFYLWEGNLSFNFLNEGFDFTCYYLPGF